MADVEQADIPAPEVLHQPPDHTRGRWGHEQVDMVVHQRVAVEQAAGVAQHLVQELQVAPPVLFVQEARLSIAAALDDVLRNIGQVESGLAGHADISPAAAGC